MPSKNKRGFNVKAGAVCFGQGCMRSIRQRGLFGNMQGSRLRVGVDIKRLWRGAK